MAHQLEAKPFVVESAENPVQMAAEFPFKCAYVALAQGTLNLLIEVIRNLRTETKLAVDASVHQCGHTQSGERLHRGATSTCATWSVSRCPPQTVIANGQTTLLQNYFRDTDTRPLPVAGSVICQSAMPLD